MKTAGKRGEVIDLAERRERKKRRAKVIYVEFRKPTPPGGAAAVPARAA